jgi:hypothetical protein
MEVWPQPLWVGGLKTNSRVRVGTRRPWTYECDARPKKLVPQNHARRQHDGYPFRPNGKFGISRFKGSF